MQKRGIVAPSCRTSRRTPKMCFSNSFEWVCRLLFITPYALLSPAPLNFDALCSQPVISTHFLKGKNDALLLADPVEWSSSDLCIHLGALGASVRYTQQLEMGDNIGLGRICGFDLMRRRGGKGRGRGIAE